MAAAEYLPPVVTRLTMDLADFRDGIAQAKALIKALNSKAVIDVDVNDDVAKAKLTALGQVVIALSQADPTIKVDANTLAAVTAVENLTSAVEDLDGWEATLAATAGTAKAALADQRDMLIEKGAATTSLSRRTNTLIARETALAAAATAARDALSGQSEALAANAAVTNAAAATGNAANRNAGWNVNWWGVPINATTLHWIITGSSEILAVAVPAMIALGSAAAVAAEGYGNIYDHMMAVYTASEATNKVFGQTTGNLIGLKSYLQQAQTAADPGIYGAFGAALELASQHGGQLAQTGLQVNQAFQTFAAKTAAEFQPGGTLGNIFAVFTANAAKDLSGLGQFFGNLGHGLLEVAAQMPGLAEWLLRILDVITNLIVVVTDLSQKFSVNGISVITLFMAYEELNRWGGLVAGTLARIGIANRSEEMDAMVLSGTHLVGVLRSLMTVIPAVVARLATLTRSQGLTTLSYELDDFVAGLSGLQVLGIAAAAVGVGVLIDKLLTARSAAQQLGDAMQRATMTASNQLAGSVASANIQILQAQLQKAQQQAAAQAAAVAQQNSFSMSGLLGFIKNIGSSLLNPTSGSGPFNPLSSYSQSTDAVNAYSAALKQQQQDQANVTQGAEWIARTFGVSVPQALGIADQANVTLAKGIMGTGNVLSTAQMQIASYMLGMQAMGAQSGIVGNDVLALGIQSQLTATKVDQLNSAWDQFIQNLSGGTGALASLVTNMQTVGNITQVATSKISAFSQGKQGLDLSTAQIAQAMKDITSSEGAQVWTNFNNVLQNGEQLADWLRIAGAEGVIGPQQMATAILGVASQLAPLAVNSKTAQTELMGLVQEAVPGVNSFSQLQNEINKTHASLNGTAGVISTVTEKMGSMAQVAQNLGASLQSAVQSSLNSTIYAASGTAQAMQRFASDLQNAATTAQQRSSDYNALLRDLESIGYQAGQARQLIQLLQNEIDSMHGKTISVNVVTNSQALTNVPGTYSAPVGVLSPAALKARGYASGTPGASSGWAWVGEAGPELVRFRGGETVIPSHVARGYAGGTGDFDTAHEVNVYLDGRQIYKAVQSQAVTTQRRTGSNGLNRRYR